MIIDFSKFVLLFLGIILCLAISVATKEIEFTLEKNKELLISLGILFLSTMVLGFIHGNYLTLNSNFVPLTSLFKISIKGNNNIHLLISNAILLFVFAFGFYQAYKLKHKWLSFLIPFFAGSLILPCIVSIPETQVGKIFMCSNLLGAFALPITIDFIKEKYNLKETKLIAFYLLVFVVLSMSTLMFWAFGDKAKPLFKLDNGLKFAGFQTFPFAELTEENTFLKYLKSNQGKSQAIAAEPQYCELFSTYTSIYSLFPQTLPGSPIKKETLEQCNSNFLASFSLDGKFWLSQKINWLYTTPKLFNFIIAPQARQRLLNAYLNKGVSLALSNKMEDPLLLKELYKVDPHFLSLEPSENYPKLVKKFLKSTKNKDNVPLYIKQIALCPYHGIFNSKSNDFDGDKIADIAFFDRAQKKWLIIYGKDEKEAEFDLNTSILANYKGSDLLIPVPSDYDGDSKTDIALFNVTTGNWNILKSTDNQVLPSVMWGGHFGETFPLPADLDGDSKADLCVYGANNGNWPTLLTTTNSYFDNTFDPSILDVPTFSYIDGDNKADYVIYRPNLGRFFVYLSSRAYNKMDSIQINLGGRTSRVVLEDYDGDSKSDLAIWTPDTGKWEIIFARNFLNAGITTNMPVFTFSLGKEGDIPMPGDYNGDGKAEIAIYHLASAKLEIAFSDGRRKNIDLSKYKKYTPASFIGV